MTVIVRQLGGVIVMSIASLVVSTATVIDRLRESAQILRHGVRTTQFEPASESLMTRMCRRCSGRRYCLEHGGCGYQPCQHHSRHCCITIHRTVDLMSSTTSCSCCWLHLAHAVLCFTSLTWLRFIVREQSTSPRSGGHRLRSRTDSGVRAVAWTQVDGGTRGDVHCHRP
jgi:hypothetical protein